MLCCMLACSHCSHRMLSRHLAAELEVHTLTQVEIASREDALGLKILNLRTSALALNEVGLVREVPVFGWLQGAGEHTAGGEMVWVTGVVDEMRLHANGKVGIHELKTRGKPTLPSQSQQNCTHLQLMLYKALWDALVLRGLGPLIEDLERVYGVSMHVSFGRAFQRQLRQAASRATTLAGVGVPPLLPLLACACAASSPARCARAQRERASNSLRSPVPRSSRRYIGGLVFLHRC